MSFACPLTMSDNRLLDTSHFIDMSVNVWWSHSIFSKICSLKFFMYFSDGILISCNTLDCAKIAKKGNVLHYFLHLLWHNIVVLKTRQSISGKRETFSAFSLSPSKKVDRLIITPKTP